MPSQEVITSDNVVVSVDAVICYEATDPRRLEYNVADFELAVTKPAQTNLRLVIGDMQLDEAMTFRAIHEGDPTPELLSLKYMEALAKVGTERPRRSSSAEMEGLFGTVGGLAEVLGRPRTPAANRSGRR